MLNAQGDVVQINYQGGTVYATYMMIKGEKMKHKTIIVLVIIAAILFLCCGYLVYCETRPLVPKSGLWQNNELNIQINFSDWKGNSTIVIINGVTIHCHTGVQPHSNRMFISPEENIAGVCDTGENIYIFSPIKLSKNELVVLDERSGKEYVFFRISEKE